MSTSDRDMIEKWSVPVTECGCWMWLRSCRKSDGYGQINLRGKVTLAHRAAYEAFKGAIPIGLLVQHSCDSRWCVNPDHLSVGTDASNNMDKQVKGRAARKLSADAVREIVSSTESYVVLAGMFGVSRSMIAKIKRGRCWSHVSPPRAPLPTPAARSRSRRGTILTYEQACDVRRRVSAGESRLVVAADYGISKSTVGAIVTWRIWRDAA